MVLIALIDIPTCRNSLNGKENRIKNQLKACTQETLLIERADQLVHPHPASVFINDGQQFGSNRRGICN